MKECDSDLLAIRVPDTISRQPKSLDDYKRWKASEYQSWLLFYSLPILFKRLPDPFFNHYSLLVAAVHILHSNRIEPSGLHLAEKYLSDFYQQFCCLYG